MKKEFQERLNLLTHAHEALVYRKNSPQKGGNGIFDRYQHPVLMAAHPPLF